MITPSPELTLWHSPGRNTLSELISMQIKLSSWKARAFDFHREISDLRNSDRCSILVKRQLSMKLFFTVEIFFQAATPSSVTATWSGCNPSTTRRTSLCIPLLMTLSPSTVGWCSPRKMPSFHWLRWVVEYFSPLWRCGVELPNLRC